jgi:hypothetical protein
MIMSLSRLSCLGVAEIRPMKHEDSDDKRESFIHNCGRGGERTTSKVTVDNVLHTKYGCGFSYMPKNAENNACSACARSKRRCGRQLPSCSRCADRGMSCFYPSSRGPNVLSSRPLMPHVLDVSVGPEAETLLAEITADDLDDLTMDLTFPFLDNNLEFSAPSNELHLFSTPATKADWFRAPESWSISHDMDRAIAGTINNAAMKKYVATLQCWFERWATSGNNPFIHYQLYKSKFPACVQIAYATLISYVHRTPSTTAAVLRIVEDRSDALIQENQVESTDEAIDLYAQLARLHALMVYQIIGLHDGDIRSRHVAEGHIPTHDRWAYKLFQCAGKVLSDTETASTQIPAHVTPSQQRWHLWILAESIRRTWLIAVSISSIYSGLQQCWAACPGGIMFTNRSGLWDAASATEWEMRCRHGDVAFLQRFHCARLFGEMRPGDVDEFGLTMIGMTFDADLVEKWKSGDAAAYV